MSYSKKQAEQIAKEIFNNYGALIRRARKGEPGGESINESFIAGFVGVEAGRFHSGEKRGQINPAATRFEKGVYADLVSLRDRGFCFIGGKKHSTYSGVRRSQIADASDAALRALATSYELTQIMGWHCINNLSNAAGRVTIADLRDHSKHLFYTVRLLQIVGGKYLENKDYESVLRIWNTGNANGKTHDPDYVENALSVKNAYSKLLAANPSPPGLNAPETARTDNNAESGAGANDLIDVLGFDPNDAENDIYSKPGEIPSLHAGDGGELSDYAVRLPDAFGEVSEQIEESAGEIEDKIDDATGAGGAGSFGGALDRIQKEFPALIPKVTIKDYLWSIIPGGGFLATLSAYAADAPVWLVFLLGFFSGAAAVVLIGFIWSKKLYILRFLNNRYYEAANPAFNTPVLFADKDAYNAANAPRINALKQTKDGDGAKIA